MLSRLGSPGSFGFVARVQRMTTSYSQLAKEVVNTAAGISNYQTLSQGQCRGGGHSTFQVHSIIVDFPLCMARLEFKILYLHHKLHGFVSKQPSSISSMLVYDVLYIPTASPLSTVHLHNYSFAWCVDRLLPA